MPITQIIWLGQAWMGLTGHMAFGQATWPEHSPKYYQAQPKQSVCVQIHVVAGFYLIFSQVIRALERDNAVKQLKSEDYE